MQTIIFVVIVFLLSWFVLDKTWYSPKLRIKRLRNSMFIEKGINHQQIKDLTGHSKLEDEDKKTQRLINALIDEYLDDEKDYEFIAAYKDEEFIKNS